MFRIFLLHVLRLLCLLHFSLFCHFLIFFLSFLFLIHVMLFLSFFFFFLGWLYDLSEVLENPIVNRTNIPEMWDCYLTALYFTCSSLTTVGFGNVSASTNAEKIFSVCVMLLGCESNFISHLFV